QPAVLHLLLQGTDRGQQRRTGQLFDDGLQWPDLVAGEAAPPLEVLLELGLGREIPTHLTPLRVRGRTLYRRLSRAGANASTPAPGGPGGAGRVPPRPRPG